MHPESHAPCDRKTKAEFLILQRPKAEKESVPNIQHRVTIKERITTIVLQWMEKAGGELSVISHVSQRGSDCYI